MSEIEISLEHEDYLDKGNPKSMYSKSPDLLKKALDRIDKSYFEKSESELHDLVKPDRVLNLLRYQFWNEFNASMEEGRLIRPEKICASVCTQAYLFRRVFRSPVMMAWLVTPPGDYLQISKEALETGVYRLREIFEMPLYDDKGKPNTSVANLMLKAIALLDSRVHGSPVQRAEIKSLEVKAHTKIGGDVQRLVTEANMDEIEKQLKQLRNDDERQALQLESQPKYEEFKSRAIDIQPDVPAPKTAKKEF